MLRLLLCALVMFGSTVAAAQTTSRERVVAVKPDGSLTLASGGNAVFANILLPDSKRAEAWLAQHVLQQEITFTPGEDDRYGRTQMVSPVTESMLHDGIAVIYASVGDVPASWQAAEQAARSAKRGLWAATDFVLTPKNAAQHIGQFHAIDGTVTRVYEGKTASYVNFGDNWHTDFSIMLPAKIRRSMPSAPKVGDRVMVRGYLYEENGPMVTLLHPANAVWR
ncbi:MAG: thermonuclease family protein [Pseudomonadota bacterium]